MSATGRAPTRCGREWLRRWAVSLPVQQPRWGGSQADVECWSTVAGNSGGADCAVVVPDRESERRIDGRNRFAIATLVLWITVVGEQVDEGGTRWNWTGLITTGLCLAAVFTVYWEGLPAIAVALLLASLAYIRWSACASWLVGFRLSSLSL